MISKQLRVRSLRATLKYISSKEEAVLVGTNLTTQGMNSQCKEFRFVTDQNISREYKYNHLILSLPPGESLEPDRWHDLLLEWQRLMHQEEVNRVYKHQQKKAKESGISPDMVERAAIEEKTASFENCLYTAWMHQDQEHQHIHALMTVIDLDGNVVSDSFSWFRSQKVCRLLEKQFDLKPFQLKYGDGEKHSEHDFLKAAIAEAAKGSPTLEELLERLHQEGIEVNLPLTRTGKVKGIKYRFDADGDWITGTDLGKEFTYPGLQKHFQVGLPDPGQVPVVPEQPQPVPLEGEPPRRRRQRTYRKLEQQVLPHLPPTAAPYEIDVAIVQLIRVKNNRALTLLDLEPLTQSPAAQQLKREKGEAAAKFYLETVLKAAQQQQSASAKSVGRGDSR